MKLLSIEDLNIGDVLFYLDSLNEPEHVSVFAGISQDIPYVLHMVTMKYNGLMLTRISHNGNIAILRIDCPDIAKLATEIIWSMSLDKEKYNYSNDKVEKAFALEEEFEGIVAKDPIPLEYQNKISRKYITQAAIKKQLENEKNNFNLNSLFNFNQNIKYQSLHCVELVTKSYQLAEFNYYYPQYNLITNNEINQEFNHTELLNNYDLLIDFKSKSSMLINGENITPKLLYYYLSQQKSWALLGNIDKNLILEINNKIKVKEQKQEWLNHLQILKKRKDYPPESKKMFSDIEQKIIEKSQIEQEIEESKHCSNYTI